MKGLHYYWSASQSEYATDVLFDEPKSLERLYPLPSFWGGYRVVPETLEFWQSGRDRLHDRFAYRHQPDDSWKIERLAP